MEEIKAPKKERKFLKAIGNIGKVLAEELVMGIARKFIGKAIDKVGNKKQGLVIAFLLVAGISYASIDSIPYPITGNKQRLGFQTTGNGLVWRGLVSDTITKPTSYADKNVKAYLVLDSVTGSIYVWKQGAWASLVGGGSFTQPVDSLFFDTSVSPNNVDTAKMRWDSELGTVVLGMYDAVPNEIGFKNFWLVKNQTGSTITKGSLVYANGTVGASGRITIAKFIANGTIDAKLLLGITAHDLTNGEDGYVISFGKIRQVNTDTFAAGAILYPSPTTAGVWTDVEPVAPNIDMPIGFCINSSSNNGTISIRVASGYALHELHDVAITSPSANASLYYKSGLWRDTTPTLLVSDTAAMLANYATKAYADTTGRLYARQDYTTGVTTSTLTWTQTDTLIPGGVTFIQVYRNGQILLPSQYTVPTSTSVVISASSFKVNDNYTVIFPRGGGAGSGGGSGSLTSISGGTGIIVNPNPITTTGTVSADLSVLMELTDTTLLNLTSRFASKLNSADTASLSNRIDAKGTGTVTSVGSGFGLLGGTITTTGTLRLDTSTIYARLQDSINVAIGGDTIKILKQEYQPALSSVLTWTITPKFPIQLKAYILVFRNGQLLNNDQYNLTDTNKITIVSTSFKVGANYTVATVSGIGSVGSAQGGNPIYPEAGIALSTGTTWASSITNNSSNWNTAFTDRLKWDGGSTDLIASTGRTSLGGSTIGQSIFTLTNPSAITFPRFNVDNSVSALSATDFRTAIGAGVGSGNGTVTSVTVSATSGNPLSILNTTTTPIIELLSATSGRNGYLTSTDWTTFNNKQSALGFTPANSTITIGTTAPLQGGGNLTGDRTISILSASQTQSGIVTTTSQLFGGSKVFKNRVTIDSLLFLNTTTDIPTQILGLNTTSGVNSVGRFTLGSGLNITLGGTLQADTSFLFTQSDTLSLNLTSRFAAKQNTLTNPVTGTGTTNTLPLFTGTSTLGNSVIQESSGNIGINTTPFASLTLGQGKNIMLDASSNNVPRLLFYETNARNENDVQFGAKIQYNSPSDRLEFVMRDSFSADPSGDELAISIVRQTGNVTIHKPTTLSSTLAVQSDITENGNNVLTSADTTTMLAPYIERGDTATMLNPYWRSGRFSGTLPIANGGTGAESASVARTTLAVGYLFIEVTAGTVATLTSNRVSLVNTGGSLTTQLDLTTATNGRMYMIKNLASGTIVSTASNVIPFNGGSAGTAILGAGNVTPQWCTLVADGTNWHIMQRN
jgi:hypothetical protein